MINDKRAEFIFLILASFIILSGLVSAEQQSLGTVKLNNCISLKQSFGNSTLQNLTAVTLPDKKNIIVINKQMTYLGGGLYNYTFCNTNQNGQYIVDGIGDVNGVLTTWTYDFNATPLGIPNTIPFLSIFLIIIVLVFIVGMVIKNNWIMALGSTLVLLLGLFIIINGIDIVKDTTTTWAIGLIIWALGMYFMFLSIEEQLRIWD